MLQVIARNRFTSFMIFFLLIFYGAVSLMEISHRHAYSQLGLEKRAPIVSREEIKQKEEVFLKNIQGSSPALSAITLLFLAVVFSGIVADVYLLRKKMKGLPWISGGLPHENALWGVKEVWQVFIFLFFVEALVLLAEGAGGYLSDTGGVEKHLLLMLNSLVRDISSAAFVIYLIVKRFGHRLTVIGLTAVNFFKNVLIGALGYLAVIPAILVVLFIMSYITQKFSYEPPVQAVVQVYIKETGANWLLLFTLFVAIVGPVIEEIFFRGFAYKAFRQKFGVRWGLVASSALFAGMHMNLVAFIPIFFLGFFLAYLYEATGSLVPSMTVHMIHNLIMVSMTMMFKNYSS